MKNSPSAVIRRGWQQAWKLSILPLLLFIVVPVIAIFVRIDVQELFRHLREGQVLQAVRLSLVTSLATVIITLLFGTPVAYYLSHKHYRFHRLVDTFVDLPTVLPPAVAGLALLITFGRRGLLGGFLSAFGLSIPFTPVAVVMAQLFVSAPYYIKSVALGLESIDCELRKSAALDGASRWQTFRYIMMPMASVSALSGSVMTWSRALGEFGATIIFAGNFPGRTQTMPLAIYLGFEIDLGSAITLSIILVSLSFLTLILVKAFLRKHVIIGPEDRYE